MYYKTFLELFSLMISRFYLLLFILFNLSATPKHLLFNTRVCYDLVEFL